MKIYEINSDSAIEDFFDVDIEEIISYTIEIYECTKPDVEDPTWKNTGENLYVEA